MNIQQLANAIHNASVSQKRPELIDVMVETGDGVSLVKQVRFYQTADGTDRWLLISTEKVKENKLILPGTNNG